ncbi:hypothetical protein [Pseudomonas sp. LFM046]|uniref:hypothetical protein n=1 Tax=Pseudomonas sp. LFM046 TaxID=1608357 RepID=UPI000AF7E96B|nr:hypothetical protein [Pseudomonas sp. LFM046]
MADVLLALFPALAMATFIYRHDQKGIEREPARLWRWIENMLFTVVALELLLLTVGLD